MGQPPIPYAEDDRGLSKVRLAGVTLVFVGSGMLAVGVGLGKATGISTLASIGYFGGCFGLVGLALFAVSSIVVVPSSQTVGRRQYD